MTKFQEELNTLGNDDAEGREKLKLEHRQRTENEIEAMAHTLLDLVPRHGTSSSQVEQRNHTREEYKRVGSHELVLVRPKSMDTVRGEPFPSPTSIVREQDSWWREYRNELNANSTNVTVNGTISVDHIDYLNPNGEADDEEFVELYIDSKRKIGNNSGDDGVLLA